MHKEMMEEIESLIHQVTHWDDFSPESVPTRKELLQRLQLTAESSAEAQGLLGTAEVITFITKNLDTATDDDELIELGLAAWIAYNRRVILDKSTMNPINCERSESKILSITDTIRHRMRTPTIALRCAALTMILASDSPDRQAKLGLVGFGVHMCTILKSPHALHDEVATMAYRAIRNLAIDDNNCLQIVNKGQVIDVFLPHFSRAADNDLSKEVLDAALYAVINLSNDTEIAEKLGEGGLVTLLARVFPSIVADNDLANAMCAALRNLFAVSQNLNRLAGDGTVADCLVAVHEAHRDDPDTMEAATWCLANMASNSFFRQYLTTHIHLMSVLSATFDSGMYAYPEDRTLGPVAEAIIFTIYFLAFKHESTDTEGSTAAAVAAKQQAIDDEVGRIAVQVVSEGAVSILQTCLQRYANREAMMEVCFRALLALTKDHSETSTVLDALAPIGPVTLILQAIEAHVAVLETSYLGLAALAAILQSKQAAFLQAFVAQRTLARSLLSQILAHHCAERGLYTLVVTLALALVVTSTTSDEDAQKAEQQSRTQLLVDLGLLRVDASKQEITVVKLIGCPQSKQDAAQETSSGSEGANAVADDHGEEDHTLLVTVCDVLDLDAEVVQAVITANKAAEEEARQHPAIDYNSEEMQRVFEALIRQQLAAGAGEEIVDGGDLPTPPN